MRVLPIVLVVLQKKESVSKLSDLEGRWIISEEAAGETIRRNGEAAVH